MKNGFLILLLVTSLLTSCRYPQDPNQTLNKIEDNHLIKVGSCERVQANEEDIINKIAESLKAKTQIIKNNQEQLYNDLKDHKLDIVMCNIRDDSPWKSDIAFTQPITTVTENNKKINYVLAIPNGENAWLKYINDIIHSQVKL